MSAEKNLNLKKTSFLSQNNSAFIEHMYIKYVNNDPSLPESWKKYFQELNEDASAIIKDINGPSWSKKIDNGNKDNSKLEDIEKQKVDSVKAIALIRAYRIRGHLIANLDPLGMMKRDYLHELHPADHGFEKEDYNRKIYLSSYLDKEYASVNEIMLKLRKVYCSTIGAEFMHISDPKEKIWFRERMERKENQINFSNNPTFCKTATTTQYSASHIYYEDAQREIKNIHSSSHANYSASFKPVTYISKVGIYDENKNLIAIASLANPVRKLEERSYTFKLKLDI